MKTLHWTGFAEIGRNAMDWPPTPRKQSTSTSKACGCSPEDTAPSATSSRDYVSMPVDVVFDGTRFTPKRRR